MKRHSSIILAALAIGALLPLAASAQRDTSKPSVDIISTFKPVIRNAVKINFSGSQLSADTNRVVRSYDVPAQNLVYAYQPVSLKPLALEHDSALYLGNRNYVKAGFGSYTTPYFKAGLGLGDGRKSLVNLYGFYTSSRGRIENQDYSELTVRGTGSYFTEKNELYADASVSRKTFFLYGYDNDLYSFKKDEVRQAYQEFDVKVGFRNKAGMPAGFKYDPQVRFNYFNLRDRVRETSVMFDVPVEIRVNEQVSARATASGTFTNFSTVGLIPLERKASNSLISITPALVYQNPRLTVHAGVTPTWDNGKFRLLPNIYAEGQIKEKVFLLQAGYVGRMTMNSFRNLSNINPYLADIPLYNNMREIELYGGLKASVGKHFNVSAKASYISYENMPLFLNFTGGPASSRLFKASNESRINNFRIHADMSFISQDKFTITAGANLNGFTGMRDNDKAWHTLPFELTGSFRWWAFDRVLLKSDLYIFGGGKYLGDDDVARTLTGGTDLSFGGEYKVNKQFSAFLDVNNVFSNKYQRWHNYEVYGLNLLGGIIVRF